MHAVAWIIWSWDVVDTDLWHQNMERAGEDYGGTDAFLQDVITNYTPLVGAKVKEIGIKVSGQGATESSEPPRTLSPVTVL